MADRGGAGRGRVVGAALLTLVLVLVTAGCSDESSEGPEGTQQESRRGADQCDDANVRAGPSDLPDFYDPCPLPDGEPGDVVRTEALDTAPAGTKAWRILYHSTTIDDTDEVVSALVVVPDEDPPAGGFPVLTLAHPTTGAARQCAPSLRPAQDDGDPQTTEVSFFELLAPFVSADLAVVATDYRGLGTPGPHPYLVGQAEGNNVLDAARAIRNLDELSLSDQTLVFGHSQGGQAAAFAAQQAAEYAPDLDVLGTAQLAPAADLPGLFQKEVEDSELSDLGLVVIALRAWQLVYPAAADALADTLSADGQQAIQVGETECLTAVYDAFQSTSPESLFDSDPLSSDALVDLLRVNSAGNAATGVPVFVGQGTDDTIVFPDTTQSYVQRLCGLDDTVDFRTYDGATHETVVVAAAGDVVEWLKGRLQGAEAPDTCGTDATTATGAATSTTVGGG